MFFLLHWNAKCLHFQLLNNLTCTFAVLFLVPPFLFTHYSGVMSNIRKTELLNFGCYFCLLWYFAYFFLNKETSNNSSIILTATKTHVIGALIQGEDRQVDGVASCCDLMSHWPYSRLSRHPGVGSHSYCSPPRGSTHSSAPYCATLLLQSTTASYNTRRYQQLPATHCLWSLYAWNSTSEPTKLREKTESLLSVCVCCVYEYVCVKWVCICLCVQRAEEMSNI